MGYRGLSESVTVEKGRLPGRHARTGEVGLNIGEWVGDEQGAQRLGAGRSRLGEQGWEEGGQACGAMGGGKRRGPRMLCGAGC
jgi:hypothetical protein